VYIADSTKFRVRVVSNDSLNITTFAGTGVQGSSGDGRPATSALLNAPYQVAVDVSNNVYISDGFVGIRLVAAVTRLITTIAAINERSAVGVDLAGNVYIGAANKIFVRRVAQPVATASQLPFVYWYCH
jgi:hypothetical protein